MSTLVSSAVGTSKVAAPKGGARRRPQPPPTSQTGNAATPSSLPSAPASVAPPTPPPTQHSQGPAQNVSEDTRASTQPREDVVPSRESPAIAPPAAAIPTETLERTRSRESATVDTGPSQDQGQGEQAAASKKRQHESVAGTVEQPAKRVKKSSVRSNARVQTTAQEEEVLLASASNVAPESGSRGMRSQRQKPTAAATATAEETPTAPASVPRRRAPKKNLSAATVDPAAEDEDAVDTEERPITRPAGKPKARRKSKTAKESRRERPANAEQDDEASQEDVQEDEEESDPELHEIDPNTVTMWEVGGDKRHGKTSEREKKMAEIDWVEVARKRREAADRVVANATAQVPSGDAVVESTEGPSGTAEPREGEKVPIAPANTNVSGVQFRLVNGQIVEDENTLTIDRQAQAEADAAQNTGAPIEEEDDLTARINRTTYINDRRREPADRVPLWRRKSDAWSEEETDRFYDALKMFGTDFFIISKMFAPKTRRHIKTKFVREERADPQRVNDALMGKDTVPMNLEHYAREVGQDVSEYMKYEGVEQAEEVIREGLAEREEELRSMIRQEEMLEEGRKKEQAERDKARRKGQGKKGKAAAGAGDGAAGPKRQRKKKGAEAAGGGEDATAGAED